MTLDELYDVDTGERLGDVPHGDVQISQYVMQGHPFIWALDAYVFAGPQAHEATQVYAQAGPTRSLNVDVYKIEQTVEHVMTVRPVVVVL